MDCQGSSDSLKYIVDCFKEAYSNFKGKTTERSTDLIAYFPLKETRKTQNQMPRVRSQYKNDNNFIERTGTYLHDLHTYKHTRGKFPL